MITIFNTQVYHEWKSLVESRVQAKINAESIVVECDENTKRARNITLGFMRQSMKKRSGVFYDKDLPEVIERCLFKVCHNQLDKHYRLTARRLTQIIGDPESQLPCKNDWESIVKFTKRAMKTT